MKTDTEKFLEALLWVADPDDAPHVANWTIREFHPEFQKAVANFCRGFRDYLAAVSPDLDPDACERSFGGNVFFSLSGHGVGFWDDRDAARGKALQAALESYSGGKHRFESIDLMKFNGKIHLSYRTAAFRREYLAKLFTPAIGNPATVSPATV